MMGKTLKLQVSEEELQEKVAVQVSDLNNYIEINETR